MRRRRILFVCEAVTLAQVVRLTVLARALDPQRYEVHFACANFDPLIFANTTFRRWPILSRSPASVARDTRLGYCLYGRRLLTAQVEADLRLFETVQPDHVVSDFRWSLTISAPFAGVPHSALINAYWSPYAAHRSWPLPDHPIISLLGERLASTYFATALPHVLAHHAAPVNAVRRVYRLPPVGNLLDVLMHADQTLLADTPTLAPTTGSPSQHHYLGPVLWSPKVFNQGLPAALAGDDPLVYVTLGSSGRIDKVRHIMTGLLRLPVRIVLATAGRFSWPSCERVYAAKFVDGDKIAARSCLVVCNGGSSTGYQALAAGRPVLGLPSNLDQCLAMQGIARVGAGAYLPMRLASARKIEEATQQIMEDAACAKAARAVQDDLCHFDARQTFVHCMNATHEMGLYGCQVAAGVAPR